MKINIGKTIRAMFSRDRSEEIEVAISPPDAPEKVLRVIRTSEEGPTNCPRCGGRLQLCRDIVFEERAPAPIEEGYQMLGIVPGVTFESADSEVSVQSPDRCILGRKPGGDDDVFVCLGLRDRREVEKYLAQDFPRGKVPEGVTSKDPCGWHGKQNDYRIKWM